MKSMSDHSNTNWLGFSLSPHMDMEQNHHQTQTTSSTLPPPVQSSFFLSPHFNNSALCYGVEGVVENGGFYSNQLSVMPLKSDGSLCIMEALTRSQQQGMVQSESPKLEDFLGCGPNMGTHEYSPNSDRETMALSLDSMYYSQDQASEGNKDQSLSLVQQQYFQPLHEMYQTTLGEELKIWASGLSGDQVGYGDLNTLSLSMSPGTQSSCVTAQNQNPNSSKKRGVGKGGQKQPVHRKSIDTFGQRTSQYRGVTRHRWTGRYEAHLWDNSCKKEGQTRKGRQVYLGGYDMEDKAARAYDLAALKYWGPSTHINFPLDNYHGEMEEMVTMSRQEYVAHLRRRSSGFSRGASMYRGVTRHHQHGRWQARIGRVSGNKDLYLGTFSTQEDAAEAYDIAAIRFRGLNAVTNFDISRYDTERIMSSNTLLPAEFARRIKTIEAPNPNRELQLSSGQIEHQPFFELGSSAQVVGHVSNASSLVTSLSGSLEASPVSSWIPMANVPVFAGWSNVG